MTYSTAPSGQRPVRLFHGLTQRLTSRTTIRWAVVVAFSGLTAFAPLSEAATDSVNAAPNALSASADLGEVIVSAGLRDAREADLNASATVRDGQTLHQSQSVHLEEVLGALPNVNWAGDTQRPRYFQIRGLGELEEYQGAPNPSVGVLIDDMDFSSIGGVASLVDVDQIDVLRGPQGTVFGANALAGLIYIQSHAPSTHYESEASVSVGNENTLNESGVVNFPITTLNGGLRVAAERLDSDGDTRNVYLNRSTTNGRHDTTVRVSGFAELSPSMDLHWHVLHAQFNDGYDAWSPFGGRLTYSDQPGVDQQNSLGYSARLNWHVDAPNTLSLLHSDVSSQMVYAYDGDWGNPQLWAPYTDEFYEIQRRHRRTQSTDLRWSNDHANARSWRVGFYHQTLTESLNDESTGVSADPINGDYAQNLQTLSLFTSHADALYGQIDQPLPTGQLSVGVRVERHVANYSDQVIDAIAQTSTDQAFAPEDHLWGGHLSYTQPLSPDPFGLGQDLDGHWNATLSRGYKASGFNLSSGLPTNALTYKAESDLNAEWGLNLATRDHRVTWKGDVFAMSRQDAQIKTSYQSDPTNPNTFVFYTGNAQNAWHRGIESELQLQWNDRWVSVWRLGLLRTQFTNFTTIGDNQQSLSRELANAPHVSGSLATTYRPAPSRFVRLEWTGMSGFYYDLPPNNTQSTGYVLTHVSAGWEHEHWELTASVHNVFNQNYTVRGFYFGLAPPTYTPALYTQLGEPRLWRLNLRYRFSDER